MHVVVEDMRLQFDNVILLERLSFEAPPRQMTVLAGPSGSGKTSILGVLAEAVVPSAGQVRFVDDDGLAVRPTWVWISQTATLLQDRTALDNVSVALLARGVALNDAITRAREHLEDVGLGHRIDFPARLLSGGEQQRLSFARALASDADLILADEPTASLDQANAQHICQLMKQVARSRVVVVATHDPTIMAAADNLVKLRPE